jgi:glucosamine 6-phosphate synthetase-like amidotransferase/phosphosugar isomerase protein
MCGLAGFARHPNGEDAELATLIGLDLLLAMQSRGTHATGIAAFGDESFICKSAVPASVAIDSKPWQEAISRITDKTTVLLGHTRHSTHPANTRLDEAAHPFRIGNVVGAHNGMIQNWRDVWNQIGNKNQPLWIVDSQAAIGALDAIDDPVKALDTLDGYWALSWMKRNDLYFARTSQAPLSVAYVTEMRTLFWCSTMVALEAVLKHAGLKKYDAYELGPNNVYRINPGKFDERGIHAEMKHAPFKGLRSAPTRSQLTVTSGGSKSRKPVPRSEINGLSATEWVALIHKHETVLANAVQAIEKLKEEVRVLRAIAGLTGTEEDARQLKLKLETSTSN